MLALGELRGAVSPEKAAQGVKDAEREGFQVWLASDDLFETGECLRQLGEFVAG
jgi:hypothetical protein